MTDRSSNLFNVPDKSPETGEMLESYWTSPTGAFYSFPTGIILYPIEISEFTLFREKETCSKMGGYFMGMGGYAD